MAAMNMVQALNSALDVMLGRDPDVVVFGEDVGFFGGVFRATEGLQQQATASTRVLRHADLPRAASSPPRSAWAPTACGR